MATAAHRDPGLQPERTTLAWVRTAASVVAVAFLCLRYVPGSSVPVQVIGTWAVVSASVVVITARQRYHFSSAAFQAERVVYPFAFAAGLTLTVAGLAVAAGSAVVANL